MNLIAIECLETRRLLAYTFSQHVIELPIRASTTALVFEVVDLNQDSRIDLLVGTESSTLEVLLGHDKDSFSWAASIPVGGLVQDLVLGDLNGDELSDLLIHTDTQIMPLLDKGIDDGEWLGFERGQAIEESGIWEVSTGNLNNDSLADIIYGVGRELKMSVGNGDATFVEPKISVLPQATGLGPDGNTSPLPGGHRLEVGDVNADGYDDVVTSTTNIAAIGLGDSLRSGPITVLANDQHGGFEAYELQPVAGDSLQLFDMNEDQHLDILAGNFDGDDIIAHVLRGTGTGAFHPAGTVPGAFRVENSSGDRVYTVERQDGAGAYIPGGLFFDTSPIEVDLLPWRDGVIPQFADLDQDGVEEVIALLGNSIAVFEVAQPNLFLDGELRLPTKTQTDSQYGGFEDFDQDGYIDLVWTAHDSQGELWMGARWGGPDGLTEKVDFFMGIGGTQRGGFRRYQTQDVNRDGFPDILLEANQWNADGEFQEGAAVLLASASREFTFEFREGHNFAPPSSTVLGDIDADGSLDRVTGHDSWLDGIVTVQRGIQGDLFESVGVIYGFDKQYDYFDIQCESLQLGDVTGDGTLDLLYVNSHQRDAVVLPGVSPYMPGDVNRDGEVGLTDLELLGPLAHSETDQFEVGLRLDMTGDRKVNLRDLDHWVEIIAKTRHGDTNLDQQVNFEDFLKLSANFGRDQATWGDGDFNGDAKVNFADFLLLSANYGLRTTASDVRQSESLGSEDASG